MHYPVAAPSQCPPLHIQSTSPQPPVPVLFPSGHVACLHHLEPRRPAMAWLDQILALPPIKGCHHLERLHAAGAMIIVAPAVIATPAAECLHTLLQLSSTAAVADPPVAGPPSRPPPDAVLSGRDAWQGGHCCCSILPPSTTPHHRALLLLLLHSLKLQLPHARGRHCAASEPAGEGREGRDRMCVAKWGDGSSVDRG